MKYQNLIKYPILFDKKWLRNEYIIKRKSTYKIAREVNCDDNTVYYHLKKLGIPTRSISESQKGVPKSIEHRKKVSLGLMGIKQSPETIAKRIKKGKDHYLWKGGISTTKEYKHVHRQKRRALFKGGGELTIRTVQILYEDNIKKYGTLTCYLCELPIEFGYDNLEHKTPLVRGGTNKYENLGISCRDCNYKKHTKTEKEYREDTKNAY